MKILFLTRYGSLGASSRVRALQYVPYLSHHGVEVTVRPLLDNRYVRHLYTNRKKHWRSVATGYPSRLLTLFKSRSHDLIWIEQEVFPMWPPVAEKILEQVGVPYVVDCDDAVFHHYDRHSSWLIRASLGQKMDVVMRGSALVIAGNEYIAERARLAGARAVELLPSVVDLDRYPKVPASRPGNGPFTIGWIGSPSTRHFLALLEEPLARMSNNGEIVLRAIGAGDAPVGGLRLELPAWSQETEVELLATCDVGVMPLLDGPFERGKCGYKLIQYMGCHLPVVASPVGVNRYIVEEGINGFLAGNADEWVRALSALRESRSLCRQMGREGRRKVEACYDLQVTAPRLHGLLQRVIDSGVARARLPVDVSS
ncbi:glycosyltransferase family 4 protein [soil metagenome]